MKRSVALLACFALAVFNAGAQAVHSAQVNVRSSLSVGLMLSDFQPYSGATTVGSTQYWSSHHVLLGEGAWVDYRYSHWLQLEAEGRLLQSDKHESDARTTRPAGYSAFGEDSFLLGPRVPLHSFGRATPYAKALFGFAYSTGVASYATKTTSDVAYMYGGNASSFAMAVGGGVDYRLSRHLNFRVLDVEWQSWNQQIAASSPASTSNLTIHPFGVSTGLAYRFF
jgi:opacity protein-like surface antigen